MPFPIGHGYLHNGDIRPMPEGFSRTSTQEPGKHGCGGCIAYVARLFSLYTVGCKKPGIIHLIS